MKAEIMINKIFALYTEYMFSKMDATTFVNKVGEILRWGDEE